MTPTLSRSEIRRTLSRSLIVERSWPFFFDVTVCAMGLAAFYAMLLIARSWLVPIAPEAAISTSPRALPLYAFYSVVRISIAYVLSLLFAVAYGYVAAYHRRFEGFMIATLDILQSIPVLSFLPGVMLAMIALFPRLQIGVELGAILLIFTGQVWNMAFSFYSSLKSIPRELQEACQVYGFSKWQRFWQLELPFSAIGLIWNSIVSVAGGWFFLIACEMFPLGNRNFRLPGLGSYLQTAASNGDTRAILWGLAMMMAIIVFTDQVVWKPAIAWSDKFKFEQSNNTSRVNSPILHLLRHSNLLGMLRRRTIEPLSEKIYGRLAVSHETHSARAEDGRPSHLSPAMIAFLTVGGAVILYAAVRAGMELRQISGGEFIHILAGAGATFLRVNLSLLIAVLWTVPVGVAIGFHPRLARIAQPLAQIAASFPATALFPILLVILVRLGGGIGIGSIALMLLGTQWYILFNVIAGAMAIPSDLKEVSSLFRFTNVQRWTTVILPGIFPYLITGLVTASGGAWNASIVAEYFRVEGRTMQTLGLGAEISAAMYSNQLQVLLLATIVMALLVVTVNRLVWRPLYRLAETRYKLEG